MGILVLLFIPIIINIFRHYSEIYDIDNAEKLSSEIAKIEGVIDEDVLWEFSNTHKDKLVVQNVSELYFDTYETDVNWEVVRGSEYL